MRSPKCFSQVLFVFALCVLILYLGLHANIRISDETLLRIGETVWEEAEASYLPLFSFQKGGEETAAQWLAQTTMRLFPLGLYVDARQDADLQTEDAQTYAMILSRQAEDENEVDAQGNLVGNDGSETESAETGVETVDLSLERLKDYEYLLSHFYTVDGSTSVTETDLDAEKLLAKDLTLNPDTDGPKILIYHTHSQEAFADSVDGDSSTTVMGMGAYLSGLLNDTYGIETMHCESVFDLVDGTLDRSKAYQLAEKKVKTILTENPSIEVVIDLHRDGVGKGTRLVTEIDGKQTAQIMFFNGMSRTKVGGEIEYLKNPYLEDNLATSLQMQIAAMKKYPGFTRRIYLKSYRYNLHLMPKSLLIEAGAQTNTVEEMRNAMEVLADILNECLT